MLEIAQIRAPTLKRVENTDLLIRLQTQRVMNSYPKISPNTS